MKLYELTGNYAQILDMLENDEISFDDIKDTLESIADMIEVKAENIINLKKSIEAEAKAFKEEEERVKRRRQSLDNKAEGLHKYLEAQLKLAKIEKLKVGTHSIRFQKNPASVDIVDESIIPAEFKTPQPDKISKTEILKKLKEGIEVTGAKIAPETKHMRIG